MDLAYMIGIGVILFGDLMLLIGVLVGARIRRGADCHCTNSDDIKGIHDQISEIRVLLSRDSAKNRSLVRLKSRSVSDDAGGKPAGGS